MGESPGRSVRKPRVVGPAGDILVAAVVVGGVRHHDHHEGPASQDVVVSTSGEDPKVAALGQILSYARQEWFGTPQSRLVLLGAGASAEAGVPDGSALDARMASQGLRVYSRISQALNAHLGYADVERSVRVLECLAEGTEPDSLLADLERTGLAKQIEGYTSAEARNELEVILFCLRQWLWIQRPWVAALDKDEPKPYAYLSSLVQASLGGTIATLNYDNTVETSGGKDVVVAVPERKRVLVPVESAASVRLLKLHGSVEWERVGDDVIHRPSPNAREAYNPAVIFGAGNKLRYYGPFLDLMRAFVDTLNRSRVVITVGYSYRDPHINDALRVWAADSSPEGKKRLHICLGPEAWNVPTLVEPWKSHEHLDVNLISKKASEAFQEMFG